MTHIATGQQAQTILEHAQAYPHHSLAYKEPQDLIGCRLLHEGCHALLAYAVKEGCIQLQWAAENAQALVTAIAQTAGQLPALPLALEFAPESFLPALQEAGFCIEAEFVDFLIDDLSCVQLDLRIPDMQFLPPDERSLMLALRVDQSVAGTTRGFFKDDLAFLREWLEHEYGNILIHPSDTGELLGICCVTLYGFDSPKGPVVWLRKVAVLPRAQGKGIGGILVAQALAYGRQNGAARAFWACDVENRHAIRLYERFGFNRRPGRGQINMLRT